MTVDPKMRDTIKDTRDLRLFLVERMKEILTRKIEPAQITGIANLSQQIYNTINIELKSASVLQKLDGGRIKPVQFDE